MGGTHMSSDKAVIENKLETDLADFLLQTMPVGIIVMNDKLNITYRNGEGRKFLERYGLPGKSPASEAGYWTHFNHPG